MGNVIRIGLLVFLMQASVGAFASSIKFHCDASGIANGSDQKKNKGIKKDIEFTEDSQKKEFSPQEVITKNENQYSLVYSKSALPKIALYKIDSGSGKTKIIASSNGSSLALIDLEVGVSVTCSPAK